MKKILCLFDYGPECFTGYATVSRNIVRELTNHFGNQLSLKIVAVNYFGEPYKEYDGSVHVASGMLSQNKIGVPETFANGDEFGRILFLDELKNDDYDGIFMIGDLGVIVPIIPLLKQVYEYRAIHKMKRAASIIYFPVDGKLHRRVPNILYDKAKLKLIPKHQRHLFVGKDNISQLDELDFFDRIITYTNYAVNEIARIRPSLRDVLCVSYHGINTQDFYPISTNDIEKFRRHYFGKNKDKFIVGSINRNQPRKDIPTTIFAFIEAKRIWDKALPEPFLYLHMDENDPLGWNLPALLAMTSLVEGKDYMFSKGDENGQVDTFTLNKIYNCIDVFLSTSRGEGWGLSVTEAMSCKIPCIVPKHTSLAEIAGDNERAYLLEEFLPVCDITDNAIKDMCHYEEVAEAILEIATEQKYLAPLVDRTLTQLRVQKGYEWVTELTWHNICKDWIRYFKDTFKIK